MIIYLLASKRVCHFRQAYPSLTPGVMSAFGLVSRRPRCGCGHCAASHGRRSAREEKDIKTLMNQWDYWRMNAAEKKYLQNSDNSVEILKWWEVRKGIKVLPRRLLQRSWTFNVGRHLIDATVWRWSISKLSKSQYIVNKMHGALDLRCITEGAKIEFLSYDSVLSCRWTVCSRQNLFNCLLGYWCEADFGCLVRNSQLKWETYLIGLH